MDQIVSTQPETDEFELQMLSYAHLLACHSVALHLIMEAKIFDQYAERLHEAAIPIPQ
jgi:hypothetical protein